MRFLYILLIMLLAVPLPAASEYVTSSSSDHQPNIILPNIILIVVDDAGFMDFGAYGGDTHTPNIDALAARGVKFSRYYTTPLCGPSRASLLTGMDNHIVGMGTLNEIRLPEMEGHPSYSMRLAPETETLAERLQSAGYQTYAIGKWGIGEAGKNLPPEHGFDRSWVLDATGAQNWSHKPYIPIDVAVPWYEDGKPVTLPEDYYSSQIIIDKTISYLEQSNKNAPFFAYIGFQAIHVPIQAPLEYIEKYNGRFDMGWDALKQIRYKRAQALGLIPQNAPLADNYKNARRWDTLSADEQAMMARNMQVNAGMLEAMDFYLGRLIAYLRAHNKLDNTLIVVLSDNGPEFNTLADQPGMGFWMRRHGLHYNIETLGLKNSQAAIGAEWASVSAAPLSLFKFQASEGGLRVPLVMAGPGVPPSKLVTARAHVMDVMPTLLDLAGLKPTPTAPPTDQAQTIFTRGRSLRPAITQQVAEVYHPRDITAFEVSANVALYQGQWKLRRIPRPIGEGQWQLFNVLEDPGETRDLSAQQPDIFRALQDAYKAYKNQAGVIELGSDFDPRQALRANAIKTQTARLWWVALLIVMAIGACGWWIYQRYKRFALR